MSLGQSEIRDLNQVMINFKFQGQYPISMAVTMVNALTLVVTTITSYAIGESKLSFEEFIGMSLILTGIILCKI